MDAGRREGRLEDRPKRIAAQALAYDRTADVGAMLDSLEKSGFIVRFKAHGIACIQIVSFHKHQNPHIREAASELPCMEQSTAKVVPDTNQGKVEPSPRSPDPGSRIPDSPSLIVGGVATAPVASAPCPTTKPKKPIKTGLPEEFGISDRVRQWAKEKGYDRLAEHLESFVSKCKAKGYTYIDWDEGFMGAVRGDWAKLRVNEPPPPTADPDSRASVEQEGESKGVGRWNETKEHWGSYKARVRGFQPAALSLNQLAGMAANRAAPAPTGERA